MNSKDLRRANTLNEEYKVISNLYNGFTNREYSKQDVDKARKAVWFTIECTSLFDTHVGEDLRVRLATLLQEHVINLLRDVDNVYLDEMSKLGVVHER